MKAKRAEEDWSALFRHVAGLDDPTEQKRLLKKYLDDEQRRLLGGKTLSQSYRLVENMDGTVTLARADDSPFLTFYWSDFERSLDPQARAIVAILRKQASTGLGSIVGGGKGGKTGAEKKKKEARRRIKQLRAVESDILESNPGTSKEDVAAALADRGLGGKVAIQKLLRKRST